MPRLGDPNNMIHGLEMEGGKRKKSANVKNIKRSSTMIVGLFRAESFGYASLWQFPLDQQQDH